MDHGVYTCSARSVSSGRCGFIRDRNTASVVPSPIRVIHAPRPADNTTMSSSHKWN